MRNTRESRPSRFVRSAFREDFVRRVESVAVSVHQRRIPSALYAVLRILPTGVGAVVDDPFDSKAADAIVQTLGRFACGKGNGQDTLNLTNEEILEGINCWILNTDCQPKLRKCVAFLRWDRNGRWQMSGSLLRVSATELRGDFLYTNSDGASEPDYVAATGLTLAAANDLHVRVRTPDALGDLTIKKGIGTKVAGL